jgi:hypothetical protein
VVLGGVGGVVGVGGCMRTIPVVVGDEKQKKND